MPDPIKSVLDDPGFSKLAPQDRQHVIDRVLAKDPEFRGMASKDRDKVKSTLYGRYVNEGPSDVGRDLGIGHYNPPQRMTTDVGSDLGLTHNPKPSKAAIRTGRRDLGIPSSVNLHKTPIDVAHSQAEVQHQAEHARQIAQAVVQQHHAAQQAPEIPLTPAQKAAGPTLRAEDERLGSFWNRIQPGFDEVIKNTEGLRGSAQRGAVGLTSPQNLALIGAMAFAGPELAPLAGRLFTVDMARGFAQSAMDTEKLESDPRGYYGDLIFQGLAMGLPHAAPHLWAKVKEASEARIGQKRTYAIINELKSQHEELFSREKGPKGFKVTDAGKLKVKDEKPVLQKPLPPAGGKEDAVQKQSAKASVLRKERSKVELQGMGEGNKEQKPARARPAKEEVDKPATAGRTAKSAKGPLPASPIVPEQRVSTTPKAGSSLPTTVNKETFGSVGGKPTHTLEIRGEKIPVKVTEKPGDGTLGFVDENGRYGFSAEEKFTEHVTPTERRKPGGLDKTIQGSIQGTDEGTNETAGKEGDRVQGAEPKPEIIIPFNSDIVQKRQWEYRWKSGIPAENQREETWRKSRPQPEHDAYKVASKDWERFVLINDIGNPLRRAHNVTPTERRKPGSVQGERETDAGGRVSGRPGRSSRPQGATEGTAAPVQSNKVQGSKFQAKVAGSDLAKLPGVNVYRDGEILTISSEGLGPVAKAAPGSFVWIKDDHGHRAVMSVEEALLLVRNAPGFDGSIRSMEWRGYDATPAKQEGFMADVSQVDSGEPFSHRLGNISKVNGLSYEAKSVPTERAAKSIVDAVSNDTVKSLLEKYKIKRLQVVPGGSLQLSEQGHVEPSTSTIRLSHSINDATNTILHELGHLWQMHLSDADMEHFGGLAQEAYPKHGGDMTEKLSDWYAKYVEKNGKEPQATKSLTGETSKPTHVNRTVFRKSIDKLKSLGHSREDIEALEGGYLLYNIAKTPAEIKAASLALRDELQKTYAKKPVKAPKRSAQSAKPSTGTNVPTQAKTRSTGNVGAKLPAELSKAKPRYGYGSKLFELEFDNDIDRAAYITAQTKKSARDADYRAFLKSQGMNDAQIEAHGAAVRAKINSMAATGDPAEGPLKVTRGTEKKDWIDESIAKDFPEETVRGNGGEPQGGRPAAGSVPRGWEEAGGTGVPKDLQGKQRPPIVVGKHTGTAYITDATAWQQIAEAAGTKDALTSRGFFANSYKMAKIVETLNKVNPRLAARLSVVASKGRSVVNASKFRVNPKLTDVVRHEPAHAAQHEIYNPDISTRSGRTYAQIASHMDDPAYAKAHTKLQSMGYVSPDVEMLPWISSGQYKSLGLTDSEAARIISQTWDDVASNYGKDAPAKLLKRAIGPARAVSRAARSRSGMVNFGGPGRPGSLQARATSVVQSLINRVKPYVPVSKSGGRYHMTAVIDPETADLIHTASNTDSYGEQLGSKAFRTVTAGLTPEETTDFVRFMQSNNLEVDNPSHPYVLRKKEMERIWGKPDRAITPSQAKIQAAALEHHSLQNELYSLVLKGSKVPEKTGFKYSGPGGENLFMNMIPKKDALGNPVMVNPNPGSASRSPKRQMTINPSRATLPRSGTGVEYETDLEKIYQTAYKNALPGAIKYDIYSGMVAKGIAKKLKMGERPPATIKYRGVEYPTTTETYKIGKKPGEIGKIDRQIVLPSQIHADIKDATGSKPFAKRTYIDPNAPGGPKEMSSTPGKDAEQALTDIQLASPKVITGHSLRVITMVTKMIDPSLPGVRKAIDTLFNAPTLGAVPRLTKLHDLANLDPVSTSEYTSKEGFTYSNQSIRLDLARANAVDNRTFDNAGAIGQTPGIKQLRELGHGALFHDPKGPSELFKAKTVPELYKAISEFGLDIRAKIMIEKVRRIVDGYDPRDPHLDDKIRKEAYKLGEYVKKPSKFVEIMKFFNKYAGTSAPMRATELKQFFGVTGRTGRALTPAQRSVWRTQTLAMSGIGTFMGYVAWNKMLSGHMPWDNKSDNTLEFGNGWHISMSDVDPADTRAMTTLGLMRSARDLQAGEYMDIPRGIAKGAIGAATDLAVGPGVRILGTATGQSFYVIDPRGNAMLAKPYPGAQYPLPDSFRDDDPNKDTYVKRFRAVLGEVVPVTDPVLDLFGGSSEHLSALRSPKAPPLDPSEVNPWDSLWRHVISADSLFNSALIQPDKQPKPSGALDPETQKYMRQFENF